MMAIIASSLPEGEDWSYEVKWDGYRAQLLHDGSHTRVISRNLKDLTAAYPHTPAPRRKSGPSHFSSMANSWRSTNTAVRRSRHCSIGV